LRCGHIRASGWITFAGVMAVIAGGYNALNGTVIAGSASPF
jgi:hypothetical protein